MPYYPIVGAKHHPPALALLRSIPQNFPLYLQAEPSNRYDENAIQVYLKSSDINTCTNIDSDIFIQELQSSGKDLEEILSQEIWQLGYIPKETAKVLKDTSIIENHTEYQVKFYVNGHGRPLIEL